MVRRMADGVGIWWRIDFFVAVDGVVGESLMMTDEPLNLNQNWICRF